jgi:hypothetical protein
MPNDALTLLKAAVVRRGANVAHISPAAEEMCKLIDHFNSQHFYDRTEQAKEIKSLKAKIAKLEQASQGE